MRRIEVAELLHEMKCIPCRKGEAPLDRPSSASFHLQVPEWELLEIDGIERLRRTYKIKDFAQALAFSVKVGALAEEEDHHPSLLTEWGEVTVIWWTHIIKGLHRNDFIMAVKADELYTG